MNDEFELTSISFAFDDRVRVVYEFKDINHGLYGWSRTQYRRIDGGQEIPFSVSVSEKEFSTIRESVLDALEHIAFEPSEFIK